MYFKPINIILCLGRKHNIDYSCEYYTSKYIWPVCDRNINHGIFFLFGTSVIPLCQTAVGYSHAIPFICWHSSHGLIMQYSLLGGKDPLFHLRITVHYMGTKLMWPNVPNDFTCSFLWKKHFQDFIFFLSLNSQILRECTWAENNLRDKLQNHLLSSMKGIKSKYLLV